MRYERGEMRARCKEKAENSLRLKNKDMKEAGREMTARCKKKAENSER
jgi:hypothetical protein